MRFGRHPHFKKAFPFRHHHLDTERRRYFYWRHEFELDTGGGGILSMLLLWTIGVVYPLNGFPEGIPETARRVLESSAIAYPCPAYWFLNEPYLP